MYKLNPARSKAKTEQTSAASVGECYKQRLNESGAFIGDERPRLMGPGRVESIRFSGVY